MNDRNSSKIRYSAAALAVASAFVMTPMVAEAAGLGRITVLSGLGQPLRAEVELNATREELNGMTARLAPQDIFRQAGVDYASVLMDLRLSLEKRSDGRQVIKVSSSKPVNEPFLDFLVELNWPAGRVIREYTFLLDPPEVAQRAAARPVSVAEARLVDNVPGGTTEPAAGRGTAPTATASGGRAPRSTPAAKAPAAEKEAGAQRVTVQAGDTLHKIASEQLYEGVSLDQMLIALYRANPDAFLDGNVNRLMKGAILQVPDKAAVAATPARTARSEFLALSRDWNNYRRKLAASAATAPAREAAPAQSTGGKVVPKVEDKAAPAVASKDQVKVSRAEVGAKGGKGASEEDRVAMDRALKEAQERLQALEKNVGDLQKLLDMKNQKLAALEQQLSGQSAPAPAAPAPVKPPEAKPVETPAEPPAKPEAEVKPATEAAPPPAPAAEPPKPAAPPVPPVKRPEPPPPPPEPTLVDTLLEDPVPLAGGGGILALLLGYLFYRRRRTAAPAPAASANTTLAAPVTEGGIYHGPGGQSIDTSQTPPQSSEFSQAGPGTIDTDEVDPVAEAEVYMAYGRDAQAEEILLEALQKDPTRTAVHVKLLEIYANRKSQKQFETLAEELYAQTGGSGPDWSKAAALGARLDPANPLYRHAAGALAAADAAVEPVAPDLTPDLPLTAMPAAEVGETPEADAPFDPEATMVVAPTAAEDVPPLAFAAPAPAPEEPAFDPDATMVVGSEPATGSSDEEEVLGLDFDLTPASEAAAPAATTAPAIEAEASEEALAADALDFDLGQMAAPVAQPAAPVAEAPVVDEAHSLDFDIALPTASAAVDRAPAEPVASDAGADLAFDLALPQTEPARVDELASPALPTPAIDVSASEPADLAFDLPAGLDTAPAAEVGMATDFEVTLPDVALEMPDAADETSEPPAPTPAFDLTSINLDLAAPAAQEEAADVPAMPEVAPVPAVDLSAPAGSADIESFEITLPEVAETATAAVDLPDMGLDGLMAGAPVAEGAAMAADDPRREEVSTKLDLAKAYEEMGDLEGARELLGEVVAEGPPDLVTEAREILARIGS